jgi:hypothetical protein
MGTMFALAFATSGASSALAATPVPTPIPMVDPRTGQSASMTGDPILAAVLVIALGSSTAALTFVWQRIRPLGRR